ncbi:MAG: hypothetical protein AB7O04_07320 [Hyphomonadaceae bacterium]
MGQATKDSSLEAKGIVEIARGEARDKLGDVKDAFKS